MTYPNYINKHTERALFSAHDYLRHYPPNAKDLPSKYILTYQKSPLVHFMEKHSGNQELIKVNGSLKIHKMGDVGFVKFDGIGAPYAVAYFEEMIALGGKEFINMGTAGGLQTQGIFLCSKSIRDEGTSYHYLPPGKFASPDKDLTNRLGSSMKKSGIEFTVAPSWTTDAPYRETKAEAEQYRKEGVATVEMESSALFAVAKVKNVKIASAFVVSDILGEEWKPQFHRMEVKENLNKLVDASLNCLGGKK